jgi:2-keto-4-pentenoate hydratase/2-oxohepta-3-ene-1,7-dioic acid hydratase in catechol pathway
MTTTPDPCDQAIADLLLHARRSGATADADSAPVADVAQAYRVQALVAGALGWFDTGVPLHWKSGGPSREAPLTHAPLPPAGVWASPADARAWPFHWCGIEAEIALRLGSAVDHDLARRLDGDGTSALVDAMTVSIEIVDSRWRQARQASTLHKLCDLQSHGALVLGEWVAPRARDWSAQTCELKIGAQSSSFRGSHSLGDPFWLLPQWLRHVTRDGAVLPQGAVVSTGTWCGLPMAQRGDTVWARFEGVGEASVRL